MTRTNQENTDAVKVLSEAEDDALRELDRIGRRWQTLLNRAENATEQLSLMGRDIQQWQDDLPPEAKHLVNNPLAQRLSVVLAELPDHTDLWACELDDALFEPEQCSKSSPDEESAGVRS